MSGLEGRRVVITGAGGGVGGALVAAFAAAGATVVACDRDEAGLPEAAERHVFNLKDPGAINAAAAAIAANGPPAAFVSNAGWTRAETLAQVTPQSLTEEMDVNFTGAALLSLALVPSMRNQPGGAAMVFTASVNAQAHMGNPAYSAAKAALLAWMRGIAVEEGKSGIRANAVVPASIRTAAWEHRLAVDPGVLDTVGSLYPLGRIVTPDEVARAVVFLASPAASGISGTTLNVDAGLMAGNLPFLRAIS